MLRTSTPAAFAPVAARPAFVSRSGRPGAARRAARAPRTLRATESETVSGVVFTPISEVAPVLASTSSTDVSRNALASLARVSTYPVTLEAAVNEQINVEYSMSYVYHSLACYFSRDSVALPGIAAFFRASSDEERDHAQQLIDFQNMRGGRVKLTTLVGPPSELEGAEEKGDALAAFELALSLEKMNYGKLNALHGVASEHGDAQAAAFLEDMLVEQAKDVKEAADRVAQLRRIGTGYPVWDFDNHLQH